MVKIAQRKISISSTQASASAAIKAKTVPATSQYNPPPHPNRRETPAAGNGIAESCVNTDCSTLCRPGTCGFWCDAARCEPVAATQSIPPSTVNSAPRTQGCCPGTRDRGRRQQNAGHRDERLRRTRHQHLLPDNLREIDRDRDKDQPCQCRRRTDLCRKKRRPQPGIVGSWHFCDASQSISPTKTAPLALPAAGTIP